MKEVKEVTAKQVEYFRKENGKDRLVD